MVVPLNFSLPSPNDLLTPMKAFNQGLSTLQNIYQTRAMPQMLQAEMQKNMLSGLPPLDAATMAYTNASRMLGEDHPTTQALKNNYNTMLQKEITLTKYQNILAGAKDFSTLPTAYKLAKLDAGGAAPGLGEGVGLGGDSVTNPLQGGIPDPITSPAANLPQTPSEINRLNKAIGGGSALSPSDTGRLYNAGIATQQGPPPSQQQPQYQPQSPPQQQINPQRQSVSDIYQQQYSPQAKITQAGQKAGVEETAKQNVIDTNKLLFGKDGNGGYMGASIAADNTLNSLNQFKKAYDNAMAKGAVGGMIFGKLDPQSQIAIKNASQLIMNNMGALKGVTNRWNISEFNTLAKGNPDLTLDAPAVEEIHKEMTAALNIIKTQGNLAYEASKVTKNPADMQKLISYAMNKYNPVDKDGNIQPEYLDKMSKLSTPEAIAAITNGKDYDPSIGEYSDADIKHTAKQRNISEEEVKRRLGIR